MLPDRTVARVVAVQTGTPRAFGPKGQPSAIAKTPVAGPVAVTPLGLAGDVQGDTVNHGGPDKALHAYPRVHYAAWRADLPERAAALTDGSFGENLVLDGLSEADLCLGDSFTLGSAWVQISQARQPCWKLNVRFATPDMARRVQASGRTGWYFRVLTPGTVAAGDTLALDARPHPGGPLPRAHALLYRDPLDRATLGEFAALAGLSAAWRELAQRRAASGAVESWQSRLGGGER
ncbi:MAG: MOSC domain-containing protein [Pseudorhodobacter sp.]|nr:MOSC domain-containing protein [Pseudorhodobacter sp.]